MRAPGLIDCGSTIHPPRLPRVFGSVPAASVRRLARCVRFGPTVLYASTPVIAWHFEHAADRKTCLPLVASESDGSAAGVRWRSSHATNSFAGWATTARAI